MSIRWSPAARYHAGSFLRSTTAFVKLDLLARPVSGLGTYFAIGPYIHSGKDNPTRSHFKDRAAPFETLAAMLEGRSYGTEAAKPVGIFPPRRRPAARPRRAQHFNLPIEQAQHLASKSSSW